MWRNTQEGTFASASGGRCSEQKGAAALQKTKKRKLKMTKQLLSVIIAVSLVLLTLITVLVVNLVRDRRPPELEEVRDIFENLIEVSPEVNELLFGKGLPTYPRVRDDLSKMLFQKTKRSPMILPIIMEV